MMRFRYKIIPVQGKQLVTADALSQIPLCPDSSKESDTLERECKVYIDYVMEHLPASKTKLEQTREKQNRDATMTQLRA